MYRDIEQRYDVRIVTMYGMTEAFPIAFKRFSEDGVPGTSGRVNPAFDVRIVDGDGTPVPAGSVGEITCRREIGQRDEPWAMSTPPRSTHSLVVTPHDEWFRTGDLGSFDDDGNLTYVDRAKDSLRRRGENVSSVEVETTVMRHPAVLEAAAVAVPSDLGEDDILVVVTLLRRCDFDHAELLDFCSARMPYFCVPRYLEVLDEIPKNVIGRVRKDLLRKQGSRRKRLGPRRSRLHTQSLGRETAHDDDLPAGVRARRGGRARGHPEPERPAQSAVLRRRLRRLDRDVPSRGCDVRARRARRSPICARRSTAATASDW